MSLQGSADAELIKGKVASIDQVIELSNGRCTGSVVGPHTILTAGHCFKAPDKATFKYKGKNYTASMEQNPLYVASGATNDQTLGYVAAEMPKPYATIHTLPVNIGDSVQLNGYGCINPAGWLFGGANGADHKLRVGRAVVTDVYALEFQTRNGAALCYGDSGGPVLIPNTLRIVGINSKADMRTTSYLARVDLETFFKFASDFTLKHNATICGITNFVGECD